MLPVLVRAHFPDLRVRAGEPVVVGDVGVRAVVVAEVGGVAAEDVAAEGARRRRSWSRRPMPAPEVSTDSSTARTVHMVVSPRW